LDTELKDELIVAARRHEILSEADLQSFFFVLISKWIRKRDPQGFFRTLNKISLRDCHKYPDIAVLRKGRPWAMIELKEQRVLKHDVARREAEKLCEISDVLAKLKKMRPKNYVICLVRQGDKRTFRKNGFGEGCRYIPIVLRDQRG
jgi:hypothetical protein